MTDDSARKIENPLKKPPAKQYGYFAAGESRRSPGGTTSQTKVPCTKTPYVGVAVVASGHDEPNKVPCTKTPNVGVDVVASGHDDKENTKERTQRNRYGLAPPRQH